jgi:hypothetical protein
MILLALVLTAAPTFPRTVWWVTDQGAVPIVCVGKAHGRSTRSCRRLLGARGELGPLTSGPPLAWRGWGTATIDPWEGTPEEVAKLGAPQAEERELALSPPQLSALFLRGPGKFTVRPTDGIRMGARALVDEHGKVVFTGSAADRAMEVVGWVDLDDDGAPEALVVEQCVNEERVTVLDGATMKVLGAWGYCGA